MIPRTNSRDLPVNQAEYALNCDLNSGALVGLPIPELVIDLATISGAWGLANPQKAYRVPDPTGGTVDGWIPLPSPFSSVCRSPLANDTTHRFYWTNPGDNAPHWATYAMLIARTPWYDLGITQPSTTAALTVSAQGGTLDGSVPYIDRSYVYTWVNAFGEESAPNAPSNVFSWVSDGTWNIVGLPTAAPANPAGYNYPPVVGLNLYRTITGTNTGAVFYLVAQFQYSGSVPTGSVGPNGVPPATYEDTLSDTVAVANLTLPSSSWANPPTGLDGLIALPNGMLVGFTGNTVHFCEVDRPHTWPAEYDQSLQYEIVGFGVWQQALVVLTQGFPSSGSGNSPANFIFTEVRVPEPCISRGSIITDLMGVYYASQNGIVMLNYFGMQNQTLNMVVKNDWLTRWKAASIIACRHRSQYLAINGTGTGFLIDYTEQRMGFMPLSTFLGVTSVWNDEYTGDAYVIAGTKVYRWDSPNTGPQIYRWRSKQFYQPMPVNLGACQIAVDPSVTTAAQPTGIPLANGDPSLALPAGAVAVFNYYVGPNGGDLIFTTVLTEERSIFRLPSGFKAFDHQVEIVACVPVFSIELATSMAELSLV